MIKIPQKSFVTHNYLFFSKQWHILAPKLTSVEQLPTGMKVGKLVKHLGGREVGRFLHPDMQLLS